MKLSDAFNQIDAEVGDFDGCAIVVTILMQDGSTVSAICAESEADAQVQVAARIIPSNLADLPAIVGAELGGGN